MNQRSPALIQQSQIPNTRGPNKVKVLSFTCPFIDLLGKDPSGPQQPHGDEGVGLRGGGVPGGGVRDPQRAWLLREPRRPRARGSPGLSAAGWDGAREGRPPGPRFPPVKGRGGGLARGQPRAARRGGRGLGRASCREGPTELPAGGRGGPGPAARGARSGGGLGAPRPRRRPCRPATPRPHVARRVIPRADPAGEPRGRGTGLETGRYGSGVGRGR